MPTLPPQPDLPVNLVERLAVLEAYVLRNDERISAIEENLARVEDEQPAAVELDRVRWFMKHGRQRPW